jgi:DNA-binding transcriptional regulator YiaG
MYHYTDGGLKNVWLVNGYEIRKTPYGEGISIEDLDGLSAAICLALAKKGLPLSGAEFRYVRSAGMKQSQAGLAKMLGDNERAVARWEKSGKMPRWADKLVRLLYLTRTDGSVPIASSIERVNAIERATKQRILLRTAKSGWAAKVEQEDSRANVATATKTV